MAIWTIYKTLQTIAQREFGDMVVNNLYRHDNAPHTKWRYVSTFPKHFHDGCESNVVASVISDSPSDALREFLTFVRHSLLQK